MIISIKTLANYEIVSMTCRRHDLTEGLKNLQCKTLIFAGESSPFHAESVYMSTKMDKKICALVEVGNPFII